MFWNKIKSAEYDELQKRIAELDRKVNLLDLDLSAVIDKLQKAISKKIIKKEEAQSEAKDIKEPGVLLGTSGNLYGIP